MLQCGVSGLQRSNGGVVNFRHGGYLLVFHVRHGVHGNSDLRVLLARLLVRGRIEGEEEEEVR